METIKVQVKRVEPAPSEVRLVRVQAPPRRISGVHALMMAGMALAVGGLEVADRIEGEVDRLERKLDRARKRIEHKAGKAGR